MVATPPSHRALVAELAEYDGLVEVGVGRRPDVARALAERGREVLAVDLDLDDAALDAASAVDRDARNGALEVVAADVTELATAGEADAVRARLERDASDPEWDAVYARNLPAELQRPTLALAERLGAACVFTTLGFEEPVVPVRRRSSTSGVTVYVARATIDG